LLILAGLIVYLSVASAHPGGAPHGVYGRRLVLVLWGGLCLNVLLATVFRVPRRPASLGAYLAHVGVLLLAGGAGWYVSSSQAGQCAAFAQADGWSPIDRFFLDGTAACYIGTEPQIDSAVQNPLPVRRTDDDSPRGLELVLAGGPAGAVIRAVQFLPRTRLAVVQPRGQKTDRAGGSTYRPEPPGPPGDPHSGPALAVLIRARSSETRVYLPFADIPQPGDWQRVDLPNGGVVYLVFARCSRRLGGRIRIESAEYLTYPGSIIPMDYRCDVTLELGGAARREVIRLNHPLNIGRYQISQYEWRPVPQVPSELVFLVSSRPGLPLVWAGCVLIVGGMLFAFYVKPLILQRRRDA